MLILIEVKTRKTAEKVAALIRFPEKSGVELVRATPFTPGNPGGLQSFAVQVKCTSGDYEYTEQAVDETHVYRRFLESGKSGRIVSVRPAEAV